MALPFLPGNSFDRNVSLSTVRTLYTNEAPFNAPFLICRLAKRDSTNRTHSTTTKTYQCALETVNLALVRPFEGHFTSLDVSLVCAGGKRHLGQSPSANTSVYPQGVGSDKPAWLAFDRQVLQYLASAANMSGLTAPF